MIFCGECGTQLADGIKFCSHCGAKISQTLTICKQCGHPMAESTLFCGNCGCKKEDISGYQTKPQRAEPETEAPTTTTVTIPITGTESSKPIRPLVCELCGGNNLIKQDGLFSCQNCGTKYTLEEARKMMISGTVQVQGTVSIDNTNKIGNYLVIADNAYEMKNYNEAEKYANMILEIDTQNAQAWFIKGQIALQRSLSAKNLALNECLHNWSNTINYSTPERLNNYRNRIANEISRYNQIIIPEIVNHFSRQPNTLYTNQLLDSRKLINISKDLKEKWDVPTDYKGLQQYLAANMLIAADNGFIVANLGQRTTVKQMESAFYVDWMNQTDNCIAILTAAMDIAGNESTLKQCFDFACRLQREVINSKSYRLMNGKYVVDKKLTRSSITEREHRLEVLNQKNEYNLQRIRSGC